MNFEEEDYIRVYTRDTATWNALGWDGQCVLLQTMRKVGRRTGVFEVGTLDPVEALSFALRAPVKTVRVGLERMVSLGVAVVADGKIVLPKFLKAQWARRTDAARKRESRDSQRVLSDGDTDGILREIVPPVTLGHTESQPVTLQSNPPNPIQPNGSEDPASPPTAQPTAKPARSKRIPEKPELLGPGWRPPEKAWGVALVKFECSIADLERALPEFRYHWIEGKGAGTMRGPKAWVRTWMNRMAWLAQNGQLYSAKSGAVAHEKARQDEAKRPYHELFREEPAEPAASPAEAQQALQRIAAGIGRRIG